jgi:cyanophycinase
MSAPKHALFVPALLAVLAAGCAGGGSDAPQKEVTRARSAPRNGRLVLVGGRLDPDQDGIYTAILGGRSGSGPVCVLPTASSAPTSTMEAARSALDKQGGEGTASTIFLAQEDAVRARDPQIVREIEHCSGFFFTSGDSYRVTSILAPGGQATLALRAILDRYRHGAVVAATGGAATALGRIMIAGGDSQDALADGVTTVRDADGLFLSPGLGLFQRGIVDVRSLAEGRVGRLLVAVLATDSLPVGLGIDEQTALVVEGDSARVVGRSAVVLLDGRGAVKIGPYFGRGVRADLLSADDRIDLRTLAVSRGGGKHALTGEEAVTPVRDPFGSWQFLHVLAGLAASSRTTTSFTLHGARLRIAESEGFAAVSRDGRGVQGEPTGLSAGPFVVDLVPNGR